MSSAQQQQQQQQQQKTTEEQTKTNLAQLGALEEDDEFEEFAAEGKNCDESKLGRDEEDQNDAHFWEDNWDDDDIEDDFSNQLRSELEKESNQPQPMKM